MDGMTQSEILAAYDAARDKLIEAQSDQIDNLKTLLSIKEEEIADLKAELEDLRANADARSYSPQSEYEHQSREYRNAIGVG